MKKAIINWFRARRVRRAIQSEQRTAFHMNHWGRYWMLVDRENRLFGTYRTNMLGLYQKGKSRIIDPVGIGLGFGPWKFDRYTLS